MARLWHDGPSTSNDTASHDRVVPSDLVLHGGAGEGNRTLMTSLEGWGSTIELRPRAAPAQPVRAPASTSSRVAYRLIKSGGPLDRVRAARGSGQTDRLRSA
jgi:hypothetical protein